MLPIDAGEVERAIQQLPGIYAVRVLVDPGGNAIEKVHVMGAPGRAPKKVVRDIETTLLLRFNLRLDYRCISLVQLRPGDLQPFIGTRVKLEAVEQERRGRAQRVSVHLQRAQETYTGVAEGPDDTDRVRLAVLATVDALRGVLRQTPLRCDAVEIVQVREERAVLVLVTAGSPESEERLVGAAYLQRAPLEAAARATLHAVNRRFTRP